MNNAARMAIGAAGVLIVAALGVLALEHWYEPGRDQTSTAQTDAAGQIARGAYLARAGNCMTCHTASGGAPFAGGRAIHTSFGSIYTSNITPDRDTGIGKWTADDFWRAIHNGKSRDGTLLYPAFPYTSYTKVSRVDSDAMFAYLMQQQPVRQPNRAHQLAFPYNQRFLLAFWRALYFQPGQYQPVAANSAQWNRGAYLVQGLGHCAACHTGRDALGGPLGSRELGGATMPALGWYAPSLTSHADALGQWTVGDIADLLGTGVSPKGAVYGPMAQVVAGSLQYLTSADTTAMAVYLKTVPASAPAPAQLSAGAEREATLAQGAKLYKAHCAACHMDGGEGQGRAYPPLAGNGSLSAASAVNPVRMVLQGGFAPSTAGNPRPYGMPPFAHALNDAEVAAVVSYLRTSWGNRGALVTPVEVARLRNIPVDK